MRPVESPLFSGQRDLKKYPSLVPEPLTPQEITPAMFEAIKPLGEVRMGPVLTTIINTPIQIFTTQYIIEHRQNWPEQKWEVGANAQITNSALSGLEKMGIRMVFCDPCRSSCIETSGKTYKMQMIGKTGNIDWVVSFSQTENGEILPEQGQTGQPRIYFLISETTPTADENSTIYAWREGCVNIGKQDKLILTEETGGAEYTKIHTVPDVVGQQEKLVRIEKPDFVQKFLACREAWIGDDGLLRTLTSVAETSGSPEGKTRAFFHDYFSHDEFSYDGEVVYTYSPKLPPGPISEPGKIAAEFRLHKFKWRHGVEIIPVSQSPYKSLFMDADLSYGIMCDKSLTY